MSQKPENIRLFIILLSGISLCLLAWYSETVPQSKALLTAKLTHKNISDSMKSSKVTIDKLSEVFGLSEDQTVKQNGEMTFISCGTRWYNKQYTLKLDRITVNFDYSDKAPRGLKVVNVHNQHSKDVQLKTGDIITSIDNELINTIPESYKAIDKLRNTTSVNVQLYKKQQLRFVHLYPNQRDNKKLVPCPHPLQSGKSDRIAKLATLLSQVRVQPCFKDGKPIGFKTLHVRNGSFIESIGIKPGDIVTSVNDILVDSMQKGYQIFNKSRNLTQFDIQIIRNSKNLLIHIDKNTLNIDSLWYCKSPSHYQNNKTLPSNEQIINLFSSTQFLPYYINSDFLGFHVTYVKKGSPIEKLGVEPGDVIKSIDGVKSSTIRNNNYAWFHNFPLPPTIKAQLIKNKHSLRLQFEETDKSVVICTKPPLYNEDGSPIPMQRLSILLSQVRFQPHYLNSKLLGFKIFHVKKGSYIESLGILPDDIITSIDNIEIKHLKGGYKEFSKLLKSGVVDVVFKRNTQTLTIQYDLNKKQSPINLNHSTLKN